MNVTRATYVDRSSKVRDFLLGFFGWFILNTVLNGLLFGLTLLVPLIGTSTTTDFDLYQTIQTGLGWVLLVCNGLLLLLNIGFIVYFARTRYWIALGALAAFATVLVLVICAAVFAGAACFAILSGAGSTP